MAALTDLGRLRSADRFGAWFCGIALNVSRRWLRQQQPEVRGEPADLASAAPGPGEAAESADVAARVRGAVAALPGGQQDAVLLFYLQGMSHREVAGELGISVGAVKSRLHQARAALAPVLAPVADIPRERSTAVAGPEEASPEEASRAEARPGARSTGQAGTDWVEVAVAEIRREESEVPARHKHIVILAERDGDRWLPIWIGSAEATALALELEAVETPRPFTYKLAASLVGAAGSRLAEVRITRLLDKVFTRPCWWMARPGRRR